MNRLMDPGSVEKCDLSFRPVHNPTDHVPCGLWLIRDDGYLLADNAIQQCRFSGIRPADNRDKSRLTDELSEPGFSNEAAVRGGGLHRVLRSRRRRARSSLPAKA